MISFTGRSLSLQEVEPHLREINDPYHLGVHLGISPEDLDGIMTNHPNNVAMQRTDVINGWLRNCGNTTWNTLAMAVEKLGSHNNLVIELRKLYPHQQEVEQGKYM